MIELIQSILGALEYVVQYIGHIGEMVIEGIEYLFVAIGTMAEVTSFLPNFFGVAILWSLAIGIILLIWP